MVVPCAWGGCDFACCHLARRHPGIYVFPDRLGQGTCSVEPDAGQLPGHPVRAGHSARSDVQHRLLCAGIGHGLYRPWIPDSLCGDPKADPLFVRAGLSGSRTRGGAGDRIGDLFLCSLRRPALFALRLQPDHHPCVYHPLFAHRLCVLRIRYPQPEPRAGRSGSDSWRIAHACHGRSGCSGAQEILDGRLDSGVRDLLSRTVDRDVPDQSSKPGHIDPDARYERTG